MSDNTSNNKKIAKNTLYLYVRMILIMAINLYVVRAYLDILGVSDYGIYNVIGGVVGLFSFLNGTLATSSQRYFSVALANNDNERLNKQFRLNITVFLLFIIAVIILAETVGLWYVNTKMTIPDDRLFAANVIYQFSIIAFSLQLIAVPYNALIIAHEQMKTFAFIGVGEALFKILIIVLLMLSITDNLIMYGFLTMFSSILVVMCYYIYSKRNYPESKYRYYWNKDEARDLISFSGWHFLGTTSVVIRSQGVNLLINAFFSPAINGARAIAFQVYSAVNQLSSNFFVAVKPQIYKSYASNEMTQFVSLIFRSTTICVFLVSLISIPFILNANYILSLWLKEVPDYAVIFTQLVLLNGLVDATSNPTICAALATKKIKKFYLVTGNLYILCLPISYVALKLGFDASSTMIISTFVSIISVYARIFILRENVPISIYEYIRLIFKLIFATLCIFGLSYMLSYSIKSDFAYLAVTTLISTILHIVLYFIFVISKEERLVLKRIINNKLPIKK